MSTSHIAHAHSLCRFIDDSPSPYHAARSAHDLLVQSGFTSVQAHDSHPVEPGRYVQRIDGSAMAWVVPDGAGPTTPFRIVGAHTDSPNLRLKPQPDTTSVGLLQVGVEVYGGVLLNSWLDRDLGISGRIAIRGSGLVPEEILVLMSEPLFRVPQLAIHLDRDISEKGLLLNRQQHLQPIYGQSGADDGVLGLVAHAASVSPHDIVGFDLMLHDLSPATVMGLDEAFISAPRLDNLLSCHAAVTALSGVSSPDVIAVATLFDHEEVGSTSATGAGTANLPRLIERISESLGATMRDHDVARTNSLFISADNAHATHPNYPDRHDPEHRIEMNSGPVLKFNASQRYTTDAISAGIFRLAAERAGVAIQAFVSRSDMACGSTIGPTVATRLGMRALDVGCAQLAMHSARELAGSKDPWDFTLLLAELLSTN